MIDLTNKNIKDLTQEELEFLKQLVNKYTDFIKYIHDKHKNNFAYILHIGIEHINGSHDSLENDWKAWSMVLLKNMVEENLFDVDIPYMVKVPAVIDEFIEYYNTEYKKYCKDIISANDFDRDRGFVYSFLNKKR